MSEQELSDFAKSISESFCISADVERPDMQYRYRFLLKIDKSRWEYVQSQAKDYSWLDSLTQTSLEEMRIRQMADISWINDESYLGEHLSSALARFNGIQIDDRTKAPIYFNEWGCNIFANEKLYENMDYENAEYRLLGLFRLILFPLLGYYRRKLE